MPVNSTFNFISKSMNFTFVPLKLKYSDTLNHHEYREQRHKAIGKQTEKDRQKRKGRETEKAKAGCIHIQLACLVLLASHAI